jgi:hypothetical protein
VAVVEEMVVTFLRLFTKVAVVEEVVVTFVEVVVAIVAVGVVEIVGELLVCYVVN